MMMNGILLLISASVALAAGGAHDGVPSAIWYQALNVVVVLGILHFYARKPLQEMFKTRKEEFESLMNSAQKKRKEAEEQFNLMQSRFDELKSNETQSIEKAKVDAEAAAEKIRQAAEEASQQIREDATKALQHEAEKIKREMKEEILDLALQSARKALADELKPEDQSRLQSEFSSRLRAVQQ